MRMVRFKSNQICLILVCLIQGTTSTSNLVYLSGGSFPWEGTIRLRPVYGSSYGTVCDDNFGTPDAEVICRMLGYPGSAASYSSAHFGQGSGTILLDEVACHGSESSIFQCGHARQDCTHSEDAGVRCTPNNLPTRLIGGRGNFEGTIDISGGSGWGTLCDTQFDDVDAGVICRSLGFKNGTAVTGAHFGELSYGTIWAENINCHGNETGVAQCGRRNSQWGHSTTCNHSNDAGVICEHTPVRLVGGSLPSQGRLEVQHNGVWGTICSTNFNQSEADVVCRMLGFDHSAVAIHRHAVGGSGPIWLSDVNCHGNEVDLDLCNLGDWDNNTCNHSNDVGLDCQPSDVRLTGGAGPWEGTVEINLDGNWGSICAPNVGDAEATVICRMLGYVARDAPHIVYHNNYFGHRTSSSRDFNDISCHGNETDINQCRAVYHSTSCRTNDMVGLKCEGAQVRLAGGATSSEGRVEILHAGMWGTVCDSGWGNVDATVVCRMLAPYPSDRSVKGTAFPGTYFGYGDGPVWLSSVSCTGNESDIMHCGSDMTGGINCEHKRDAGVRCEFDSPKRLQGGVHSGTVEVLNTTTGSWNSYCAYGWNITEARVICREVGYWNSAPDVQTGSFYGRGNGTSYATYPECTGSEGSLEMCPMKTALGQTTCSTSRDVGVLCNPTRLDSSKIRLVDGPGPWNGRLEVQMNGNWGSACFDSWNNTNNDIVCRTLHFTNVEVSSYPITKGLTSTNFYALECDGLESDIGKCRADLNITKCKSNSYQAVGLDCSGGITVSLNTTSDSGAVLVHTSNTTQPWSVCNTTIDITIAKVLCSSAGFSDSVAEISYNTQSTMNPVLFSSIGCDGWETHISQCSLRTSASGCNATVSLACFENCSTTTTSTTGQWNSASYPHSYPGNQDCVLFIQPVGQTPLKIQFHDLQLAGDGDFIEVKTDQFGQQLGYFANSSNIPYLVSSSGFYIRFKTNSARSSKGFNLTWNELKIEDAVTMGCGSDGWNISVNSTILRHLYPNTMISQVKLSDQHCIGRVYGDMIVFKQSYTNCSTATKTSEGSVIYTNALLYPDGVGPFPLVVHGYRWKIEVECDVARTDTIINHFHPNQTIIHETPHLSSTSHYTSDVTFYTDATFYKEIQGNPVNLKTGDDVFIKVHTNTDDTHVKMRLDTCYTKPHPRAEPSLTYTLIKDGCAVDSYTNIISQGIHETRFVFNAFEFPANHDAVYIFCNATYCKTSDFNSACSQTCHSQPPSIIGRAVSNWNHLNEVDKNFRFVNV